MNLLKKIRNFFTDTETRDWKIKLLTRNRDAALNAGLTEKAKALNKLIKKLQNE